MSASAQDTTEGNVQDPGIVLTISGSTDRQSKTEASMKKTIGVLAGTIVTTENEAENARVGTVVGTAHIGCHITLQIVLIGIAMMSPVMITGVHESQNQAQFTRNVDRTTFNKDLNTI